MALPFIKDKVEINIPMLEFRRRITDIIDASAIKFGGVAFNPNKIYEGDIGEHGFTMNRKKAAGLNWYTVYVKGRLNEAGVKAVVELDVYYKIDKVYYFIVILCMGTISVLFLKENNWNKECFVLIVGGFVTILHLYKKAIGSMKEKAQQELNLIRCLATAKEMFNVRELLIKNKSRSLDSLVFRAVLIFMVGMIIFAFFILPLIERLR